METKRANIRIMLALAGIALITGALLSLADGYNAPITRDFVGTTTTITNLHNRCLLKMATAIADAEMGGMTGTNRFWFSNGGDPRLIVDDTGTNMVSYTGPDILWEKSGTIKFNLTGSANATNRVEVQTGPYD